MNHLWRAGVFEGNRQKPEPLYPRQTPKDLTTAERTLRPSYKDPPQAASQVKIKSNGDVDCQLTAAEVCKTLGLQCDGKKGPVGRGSFA